MAAMAGWIDKQLSKSGQITIPVINIERLFSDLRDFFFSVEAEVEEALHCARRKFCLSRCQLCPAALT
jgi:hypothetical protein